MSELFQEVEKAFEALKKGGTILYPTDTVWGLGCDATNKDAVDKIYQVKDRDPSKSLIILLDSPNKLQRYVKEVPEVCWDLIEYSTKPITIIYPEGYNLADGVCASDGSIGIRCTNDPFCQKLISKLNRPIVSTSANISGHPTPESFSEISEEIRSGVDYIVNLRQNEAATSPSSILKVGLNGEIVIIRK